MLRSNFKPQLKNQVIVGLDVDSGQEAYDLAKALSPLAGGFKVGPRLLLRYGSEFIKSLTDLGPVFIDSKFFDIESTVLASVRTAFEIGATLVTVSAYVGPRVLEKLNQLEVEFQKIRPFRILIVTVLTSWNSQDYLTVFKSNQSEVNFKSILSHVKQSGLRSLVCSVQELKFCPDPDWFLVTPGIRLDQDSKGDQERTSDPLSAILSGATAIVIARPIIRDPNPIKKLESILSLISSKVVSK